MNPNKSTMEIASLREAAIEDLMAMSDEELRAEANENGDDLEAIAFNVRRTMREAAATALRLQMISANNNAALHHNQRRLVAGRPSLGRIKQIVQQLFDREPAIGLAFREGKRQSEADWQSLYDDLFAMGVIKEENNDH